MNYSFTYNGIKEHGSFLESHNIYMYSFHGRFFTAWQRDGNIIKIRLDEEPYVTNARISKLAHTASENNNGEIELAEAIVNLYESENNEGQHSKEAD